MPFLLYTTIGAGIWNTVLAILGYSLASVPGIKTEEELIRTVTVYSHEIGFGIIAIILLVAFIFLFRKKRRKKANIQA